MDKLIERQPATRASLATAPALAVQFFLIPLAVVGVTVAVYAGFRTLFSDRREAQDYLNEIRWGGANRRWPAAYELSRLMADPKVRAGDPVLGPALVRALEESKGDDPRVRRYLALAIGRLDPPLPAGALPSLVGALEDPDPETRISAIWALGSAGDASVVPQLRHSYDSSDAGIRKMAVYALGALPGEAQMQTLQAALNDPVSDIQWNAAVALARHGNREGVAVLKRMLDRSYVEQAVTRTARPDWGNDPVAEVMISGVRAAAILREEMLRPSLVAVSRHDRSLRVRQAALEALRMLGG